MKRFAEVEVGIGISIFFAAASLTSVPPGIDLTQDRASWAEVVERNTPVPGPGMTSPDLNSAGAAVLAETSWTREAADPVQAGAARLHPRLGRAAATQRGRHRLERVQPSLGRVVRAADGRACPAEPGRGALGAALAADACSGSAVFLLLRSDPGGLADGLCRPAGVAPRRGGFAAPHLCAADRGVRPVRVERSAPGGCSSRRATLWCSPCFARPAVRLLLTHTHAIANVKDQLLIELTHTPLALAGITRGLGALAGAARWTGGCVPRGRLGVADVLPDVRRRC